MIKRLKFANKHLLENFLWDLINKVKILHANIKRNKKLRKYILPAEAEKVFKLKTLFKFPYQRSISYNRFYLGLISPTRPGSG